LRVLSGADQEWLWSELAHAIRNEQALSGVLRELAGSHAGERRGEVCRRLAQATASGAALSDAVARDAKAFAPGAAAALAAGEKAGNLPDVLRTLSETAQAQGALEHSVATAVAYPIAIALAAIGAILVIDLKVYPMFEQMFDELDVELPALTSALPALVHAETFVLLLLPAALLILLYLVPAQWLPPRGMLDFLRMKTPLVGDVVRKLTLVRWCRTMDLLVRAGVTEPEAVRLAGDSAGNAYVAGESRDIGRRVEAGDKLGDAMGDAPFFPEPLLWMVRAADGSGGHAHVWDVAADLYRNQAETAGRIMSMLLAAAFVVVIAQVVGMTVIAAFLPLIHLMNSMGG